jgi:proteasome accessory factor B
VGDAKPRDFAPYFIEPTTQGGLYTIGYDEQSRQIRTFKFQRIQRAELLNERYHIPDDFSADDYLAAAWGIMGGRGQIKVTLVFHQDAASLIKEHRWHPSQQLTDLPGGDCQLSVWVNDWREMQPWVRSWGGQVTVLEPADLRRALAEDARRIVEAYASDRAEER